MKNNYIFYFTISIYLLLNTYGFSHDIQIRKIDKIYKEKIYFIDYPIFENNNVTPPTSITSDRNNICANDTGTITLTSAGGTGDSLKWYKDSCGINYLGTGTALTIPSPEITITYYARWESGTEFSTCVSLTVNIIPITIVSILISENTNHICQGTNVVLSANIQNGGNSPILQWYKNNQLLVNENGLTFSYTANASESIYCNLTTSLTGCVNSTTVNSNSINIIVDNPPRATHVKLFLEGFYNSGIHQMNPAMNETTEQFSANITDSVMLMLAEPHFPFLTVYSFGALLQTSGYVNIDIPCSISGNYFLVVKHRNHIETWSAFPIMLIGDTLYYDFTIAANKANSDNQKQMETDVYAIYTGDVNQDGLVDGSDMSEVETANNNFLSGYLYLDVNGDGLVDGSDMSITETNNNNFVSVFQPNITLATLNTISVSEKTNTTAKLSGNIIYDGGSAVTERGFCYGTSPNPTTSTTKVIAGSGMGNYSAILSGLIVSTKYYVRAYAINSAGTTYSNELILFTFPLYDIDGNGYDTVHINNLAWMKQNLNVTHYRNGDSIPCYTSWGLTTGACSDYENLPENGAVYGKLYNFYAVADPRNLCPVGWHVSNNAEWHALSLFLDANSQVTNQGVESYIAGEKLKEAGTTHWAAPNTNATNETGFTALPGGLCSPGGSFYALGASGFWYVYPEISPTIANCRALYSANSQLVSSDDSKHYGLSVRCVKGEIPKISTTNVSGITQYTAICGGDVTSDSGAAVTSRGICWSTLPNPTIELITKTSNGAGIGNFTSNLSGLIPSTTYYIRAYASNTAGTAYGNEISFVTNRLVDYDSNEYDCIKIGTQIWIKQNLKTTHYRNGDSIPNVTNGPDWGPLLTGAYCSYNNDTNLGATYGRLYNFYTVADDRKLCPAGWHVPSDAEWTVLTDYLGGLSISGGKLKEIDTLHWISPNTGATNESGFTALPGGSHFPNSTNNGFSGLGSLGFWWSGTEYATAASWRRYIVNNNVSVYRQFAQKRWGGSVRCLMGELPSVSTSSVTNISQNYAIIGGNITSDGGSPITARGVCWGTSQKPTLANSFTTNGSGTGSFTSNLINLTHNTIYYVRAYASSISGTSYGNEVSFTTLPPVVYDIDGNGYDTVKIGTQIWLKQNLNVTHYRNGDAIPNVTDSAAWRLLYVGAYCNYNNDTNIANIYGKLYNFYTVADSRHLCPIGWHVPANNEISDLASYLGGYQVAGGKLKETGTSHWGTPNTGATNSSGFTALAGGVRSNDGVSYLLNQNGLWWNSANSDTNQLWSYHLYYNYNNLNLSNIYSSSVNVKIIGRSIRCLKGDTATIVTIPAIAGSTLSSAVCGGTISSDGGLTITDRGICWSTSHNPTTYSNHLSKGTGSGSFTDTITNLLPGTTYYIRAYATNNAGTIYGNEVSFTTSGIALPAIGQPYQGGLLAYILQTGDPGYDPNVVHGIIAAPYDQSTGAEWGCNDSTILGAYGEALGTGYQNTIAIVNTCPTAGIAARICYDLILNGYSDWYLPSIQEMTKLADIANSIGLVNDELYWTSTEEGYWNGIGYAYNYYVYALWGNVYDGYKTDLYYVRAIRSF